MSVADDIQDIIAGVSADIASRKPWGRVELEQLRRQLTTAATDVRKGETDGIVLRSTTDDVLAAIDAGIINLAGVANRARQVIGAA